MNLKNKHSKNRKLPLIVIGGLVLVAGLATAFLLQDTFKTAMGNVQADNDNSGKPKFVFATEEFPDWSTTGNNWPNPKDATYDGSESKDTLPVADIMVQQCTAGSHCSLLVDACRARIDKTNPSCEKLSQATMNAPCFAMASYDNRIVNPEKAVTEYVEQNKSFGATLAEAGNKPLTMSTPEGDREYQLHYYTTDTGASDQIKHGTAIGYIALSDGHIEVQGVCNETSQLDEVLPVLSAIRLMAQQ